MVIDRMKRKDQISPSGLGMDIEDDLGIRGLRDPVYSERESFDEFFSYF